jgi:hypothetical protein
MYKEVNIQNHMQCFKLAMLGPANVKDPSDAYWKSMADFWKVPEGVARTRLCLNCEEYDNSPDTIACVNNGPGGKLRASELPIMPKWIDDPTGTNLVTGVCERWAITCSPLRTCRDWHPIGSEPDEMM